MDEATVQKVLGTYEKLMREIINRVEVVIAVLDNERVTGYRQTNYEVAALNCRMIAESIVYANMVGHESKYAALHPKYEHEWQLDQIIGKIKAINPNFYLDPTTQEVKDAQEAWVLKPVPAGEWLTEVELIEMYDLCSKLSHVTNPFSTDVNLDDYTSKFRIWIDKIIKLLNHHSVDLSDDEHMIICMMNPENTCKPKATLFAKVRPA